MKLYIGVHFDKDAPAQLTVSLSPAPATLTRATMEPLRSVLKPEYFELLVQQALDQ